MRLVQIRNPVIFARTFHPIIHATLVPLLAILMVSIYLSVAVIIGQVQGQTLLYAMVVAGVSGLIVTVALPHQRTPIIRCLTVVLFVFVALRCSYLWITMLHQLPLSSMLRYWLVDGPGGGFLSFLPATLVVLLLGRVVWGASVREQFAGRITPRLIDVGTGCMVGGGLAAITLGLAVTAGTAQLRWEFMWTAAGVNLVSNLYEEVLARGLVLHIVRQHLGNRAAMLWSSLLFGLMHGFGAKAVFIALISWAMAWAVLQVRSLWTGWIAHNVMDAVVDSLIQ